MKVIVCGSRGYASEAHFKMLTDALEEIWPFEAVVHGGCKNSGDELAHRYCGEFNVEEWVYLSDWTKHGKSAGFIRNVQMAELDNVSRVVAIWDGRSNGTRHMIEQAVLRGIPGIILPAKLQI